MIKVSVCMVGINETAETLGVKVSTLYAWVHTKQIPHYKVGGLVKFRKEEIDAWLEERRVPVLNMDTLI